MSSKVNNNDARARQSMKDLFEAIDAAVDGRPGAMDKLRYVWYHNGAWADVLSRIDNRDPLGLEGWE